MHTATDNIAFYGDLRVKADSLNYRGITAFSPLGKSVYNLQNSILYTTRLRLNMKAKVWDNVGFSGRLSMYKGWGDSTGVKVMDSFTGVTMDGTNGGNTTGDFLRVERAYFDWKEIGGSNFYLSIGRRPSTYGPPTQYRENELRGGTPSGHLVNFNFDGVTVGYKLGEVTGVDGQTIRFCYGQGYESEVGNGELSGQISLKDTHLGGFNVDLLNDGTNFVQATLFRAQDITDGFKSIMAFDAMGSGLPIVFRMNATENVGNMWIGGLGVAREEENGLKYFASFGWNQSDPNGRVSQFPTIMGHPMGDFGGLLSEDGQGKENGYSVYVGVQIPTGDIGKFGLEYNWGSQYWFNFVQAADDAIAPKLAARGQVAEVYYILDVNPNTFIKLAGLYYDYEYSGSSNPIGKPTKISEMTGMEFHAMMPVVDKAYDANISLTVKF
ncbi:MAG: DUF3373 family protein, partial [Desulfuromonadales bacterium]|nr:DUF3373 family protein [Desulfuromonadales bacterium]